MREMAERDTKKKNQLRAFMIVKKDEFARAE
jgi:hypothetical protein